MNDFTKDELKTIILNLCVNPKTNDVFFKIKDMIKNYNSIDAIKKETDLHGGCVKQNAK